MGLSDVQVPRPGVWRWEGAPSTEARTDGVLQLTDPTGAHRGSFWPEGDPVPDLYRLLTELAFALNENDAECSFCRGPIITDGMCSTCRADCYAVDL